MTPIQTKPPPVPVTGPERSLFQSIDELHARHGHGGGARERIFHAVVALSAGTLLFGALYGLILFLE